MHSCICNLKKENCSVYVCGIFNLKKWNHIFMGLHWTKDRIAVFQDKFFLGNFWKTERNPINFHRNVFYLLGKIKWLHLETDISYFAQKCHLLFCYSVSIFPIKYFVIVKWNTIRQKKGNKNDSSSFNINFLWMFFIWQSERDIE